MTSVFTLWIFVCVTAQAPAQEGGLDRVALHNGSGIVGQIIRVNSREIFLRVGSMEVGIPRSAIAHIEWGRAGEWDPYQGVRVSPEATPAPEPVTERPRQQPPSEERAPLRAPAIDPALKARIDLRLAELPTAQNGRRQRIVEELGDTGETGQIYLASILADHEPIADWILSAILVNPSKAGLPFLAGQLSRVGDATRSRIVIVLGNRKYREAEEAVAEALQSKDDELRLSAVNALAAFGNPRWVSRILDTLETAPPELAERAVDAVAALAEKDDTGVRAEADFRALQLCRSARPVARANGARLAGKLRLTGLGGTLRDLVLDEAAAVRAEAVIALRELSDADAIEVLAGRVSVEEDQWVKIQIAQALGRILRGRRDFRPLPGLIALLRDPNEQVRNRASQALMEITGERLGQDAEAWETWYRDRVGGR